MWVAVCGAAADSVESVLHPAAIDVVSLPAAWPGWRSRRGWPACCSFLTQAAEYRLFGLFDLVFLVPEAILLTIALRHAPATPCRCDGGGDIDHDAEPSHDAASSGWSSSSWSCVGGARRHVRLHAVLPRGAGRPTSPPTRNISCSVRSAPRRSRAFRTGSGWCCRVSFPSICPGPAATRRSASCRKDGHEMPVGFSKVTVGFPRVGDQLRGVSHRQLSR